MFVEVTYDWEQFFQRFFPDEDIRWGNDEQNTEQLRRVTEVIHPFAEENNIAFDLSSLIHGRMTLETTDQEYAVLRPFIEQGGLAGVGI